MLTVVINHNIKICGGAIWTNLGSFNNYWRPRLKSAELELLLELPETLNPAEIEQVARWD